MKRHCRYTSIGMPELLVRSTMPDLAESLLLKKPDHLPRLQNGHVAHFLVDHYELSAHKFGLKTRLTVLQEESDDLLKILIELVETLGLRMRAGKAGHIADIKFGVRAFFDYGSVSSHHVASLAALYHWRKSSIFGSKSYGRNPSFLMRVGW